MSLERTAVNPWQWSVEMGFNQAELVAGSTRMLHLSGQTAVDAVGHPQHDGDMGARLRLALDNLETVLAAAEMTLGDVVRMNIYTTDVDALVENYGVIAERMSTAGVQPPGTLLGVTRLAYPDLMVELEATAQR